jgi:hypothetical protein
MGLAFTFNPYLISTKSSQGDNVEILDGVMPIAG